MLLKYIFTYFSCGRLLKKSSQPYFKIQKQGTLLRFKDHSSWSSKTLLSSHRQVVCMSAQLLSRVPLFASPWPVARVAPLSMGLSQQEYWSGLPFPTPGYLSHPGIKPKSLAAPVLADRFFTTEPLGKPRKQDDYCLN